MLSNIIKLHVKQSMASRVQLMIEEQLSRSLDTFLLQSFTFQQRPRLDWATRLHWGYMCSRLMGKKACHGADANQDAFTTLTITIKITKPGFGFENLVFCKIPQI